MKSGPYFGSPISDSAGTVRTVSAAAAGRSAAGSSEGRPAGQDTPDQSAANVEAPPSAANDVASHPPGCTCAVHLAWRYIPRRGAYSPDAPPEKGRARVILRDRPFLVYLFSGILASFVYVAYETVLPISLTVSHGLSPATWGFLVIVNPALVTAFQLRLTRRVERWSAATKLGIALPLMGLPFLLLSVSSAIPVVVGVIVLFVFGEMLWIPASQSVVARLAPADLRGAYMGAFGISWSVSWALGPFLGLQVHQAFGDGATWVMFAAMSLVAGTVGAMAAAGAARGRPAVASAA